MQVHLDRVRCQGHGRCYVLAPAVFESDDDGYGIVVSTLAVNSEILPDLHDAARKGAANCPEDAITLTEG
ncbi:MAG: ferredoxin [Acidimicrobiales bacterium]